MSTASSASVATPLAMVRILLFICWGQLMVATLNTIEAKETKETQNRQGRTATQAYLEDPCLHFDGVLFEDKCLYFSKDNEENSWTEAKDACFAKKGELAIFADNPKEALKFVEDQNTDVLRWWVGATDLDLEGNWEWNNGEAILWPDNTPPWGVDEPNGEGHENCLDVMRTGEDHGYNDENCDNLHQYICEIGCSFAGTIYPPGSFIHEACAVLQCNGATGRFDIHGYDNHCPQCYAWGDPHIRTFDQSSQFYGYQQCGNHTLTQNGNLFTPSYAVYASFVSCTYYSSHLACIDNVTLKNDNQTLITLGYQDTKLKIQVNDKELDSELLSSLPSIINLDGTDYPVIAWISEYTNTDHKANCVSLQGSSGIKVKFCGTTAGNANSVWVWASPDIVKGLKGLCGTVNDNVNDDFTTRDGSQTWNFTGTAPDDFGLSWIADTKEPGQSCGNGSRRTEAKSACETNTSLPVIFRNQCEDAVLNGTYTAETSLSQILIDACVYDVCVATDPVKGIEAVHAAMPIHAHIKDNTVGHCHHKRTHKCKTHNGTCILKTENCDGTIIERGCHGRKCDCCAPSGCEASPKCLAKQGKCQLLKDAMNCDGIVNSELCSGNKCACCHPEAPKKVKERKQCLKMNGKCMQKDNWGNCGGILKIGWCKGKKWACCYTK